MGEVYRAHDSKLDREVALKVLPAALASDPEHLERFQREARAVASLNHPNIVTIHSVEHVGDIQFLTMELISGESLDSILAREHLPLAKILNLATALAEALAAAHSRGIVHRDLKPANVMVTPEGRVKVLDFGLVKLTSPKPADTPEETAVDSPPMTSKGSLLGTAPYMSPEQVRGMAVDHRTDIFSLGVIMYEMATGSRPFAGDTSSDLISSILRDTPPSVSALRMKRQDQLERIISRCLSKQPQDRFQSASELLSELRALGKQIESGTLDPIALESGGGSLFSRGRLFKPKRILVGATAILVAVAFVTAIKMWFEPTGNDHSAGSKTIKTGLPWLQTPDVASIAVMPFINLSGDKQDEYFSDGLTADLLNLLVKVKGLRVAARTSSFAFKNESPEVAEIGAKLNVGTILEGSVRHSGNRVRVTAQLINVEDGFHIWSETYERELDDLFAVQDDIARSVVSELTGTLLGTRKAVNRPRSGGAEAYNLYLQGRHFFEQRTEEDLVRAIDYFQRSLELDPEFAAAWTGLSGAYSFQADMGVVSADEGYGKALEAAQRARDLEPELAEAHARMGWIQMNHMWDWAAAYESFQRALELEPGNASTLRRTASLAVAHGHLEEAVALDQRAAELDPVSWAVHYHLGLHLYYAGHLEDAEEALQKANELKPDALLVHTTAGLVHLAQGRPQDALTEIQQEPNPLWRLYGLAIAHASLGNQEEANTALGQLIEKYANVATYQIAVVHAFRNEPEKAFLWLDKAYEQRDPGLSEMGVDPLLANIKIDPRWSALLRKMGLTTS